MMKGWKKVADIPDTEVRDVLCRALRAHEIPYDREFHMGTLSGDGPVFDRISVEAVNLCCAQTLYTAILSNRQLKADQELHQKSMPILRRISGERNA